MSVYGFDPQSRALWVAWATGRGRRASVLTVLPSQAPEGGVDSLVAALDGLSKALWDTYVHPASQFGDPDQPNTEAWRLDLERKAFAEALSAVTTPNLPLEGLLTVSYSPVVESGHRVGRALHSLDIGEGFTALIREEVAREQAAVEAAEAGDLTGRASQVVVLSRIGASPTQIEVAWQVLLADPLGSHEELLTDFEPSAAAIAAAACLHCAAQVAEEASGVGWTRVVMEADNIQALPVETPTRILELLADGKTAREAVTMLLAGAHTVADGELRGADQLAVLLEQAQRLKSAGVDDDDVQVRLTPLDPHRPAPDLLEDLLTAIDACFLLWQDYIDDEDDWDEDDEDDSISGQDQRDEAVRQFSEKVQAAMTASGSPT